MKVGEEFSVKTHQLAEGLVGRIVDVTVDGEVVHGRVTAVRSVSSDIKVIDKNLKE